MSEQLISEAIEVDAGAFAPSAMTRGEPGAPKRFRWRGGEYVVAEVLERWKDTRGCRHGSAESYVGRHWVRVLTTSGHTMTLYIERNPRSPARKARRWFLYTLEAPEANDTE